MGTERLFAMVNVNWPTALAGEAYNVSSVSSSACHIGGPTQAAKNSKLKHNLKKLN